MQGVSKYFQGWIQMLLHGLMNDNNMCYNFVKRVKKVLNGLVIMIHSFPWRGPFLQ